jgi:hypothetical protein
MVHGAVLPPHLLVQENEHGVRLVGYGCAGYAGKKIQFMADGYSSFYPAGIQIGSMLTPQLDVLMSARCIVAILGGDPADASLPAEVPAPLARLIRRVALGKLTSSVVENAWQIREELGVLADSVFGAPQFTPIIMPK